MDTGGSEAIQVGVVSWVPLGKFSVKSRTVSKRVLGGYERRVGPTCGCRNVPGCPEM